MALGKNTTIGKIEDIVRVKTGTVSDKALSSTMMLDVINLAVAELAKKLSRVNAPFYMSSDTVVFAGGGYSISSLKVDRIIKLVDSSLGLIRFDTPDAFERASSFSNLYASSLFAVQEGELIRIFKGSNLGSHSTIKLYYFRTATPASTRADYPDIPDSFTSTIVKMVCADIYAYKNGKRDVTADAEVSKDIEELTRSFLLEAA